MATLRVGIAEAGVVRTPGTITTLGLGSCVGVTLYDEKKGMISELRTPITPKMLIQEINRYADSEFRYADKSDEAAIAEMIRNHERASEAQRRIQARGA